MLGWSRLNNKCSRYFEVSVSVIINVFVKSFDSLLTETLLIWIHFASQTALVKSHIGKIMARLTVHPFGRI